MKKIVKVILWVSLVVGIFFLQSMKTEAAETAPFEESQTIKKISPRGLVSVNKTITRYLYWNQITQYYDYSEYNMGVWWRGRLARTNATLVNGLWQVTYTGKIYATF
jgi:hypothetical protein